MMLTEKKDGYANDFMLHDVPTLLTVISVLISFFLFSPAGTGDFNFNKNLSPFILHFLSKSASIVLAASAVTSEAA